MYVETSNDSERPLVIQKVLMDLAGGAPVAKADFKTASTMMAEGAVLGLDAGTGLYHLVKTAKVVAGGSLSAPRIALNHELKVGSVISDGLVALTIATITTAATYDTLTFSSGTLVEASEGNVLYVVATEDTTGAGAGAEATVTGKAGNTMKVKFPSYPNAERKNGLALVLARAADDVLVCSFAAHTLTITVANTTKANNNTAQIQAAIRALGTVEGVDLSLVVCTGTSWDGDEDGASLTAPTATFTGGITAAPKAPKYTPAGIALNSVDLTHDNQGCGLLIAGIVIESILPYPVTADMKATLNQIKFI